MSQTGPLAPPAHRGRRLLLRGAQAALVAASVYFLAAYLVSSWEGVRRHEWAVRPGWLALSAAAFLTFYLAQAVLWWLLLRGFGVRTGFLAAASTWAKSILARYVPGTVFMFVGRAWMSHAQGLPVDRVSAAMVYEQALGVCSALLTIAVLFPFWEYRPGIVGLGLLAAPVLIALLHPRIFAPLAEWVLRRLRREPLGASLRFGTVVALLWYSVAAWLVAGFGAWALARGVVGLGPDALPQVTVAYALAYAAGMAAFVFPSGIGVREAVLTASLRGRLVGGVALAWALLLRVWVTAVELAFVGLVVAAERLSRRARER